MQAKLATAKAGLEAAVQRAKQRVETLKEEADAKADSLNAQLSQTKGDGKTKIEDRVARVKSAHHARGAKLSRAWSLTEEALTA